jgi:hypothetical protein
MNGFDPRGASNASPDTQRLVDQEVQRILVDAHGDVTALLVEHRGARRVRAHGVTAAPSAKRAFSRSGRA